MIVRAMALAAILWGGAATAAPEPRTATGKWVVDFAEAQCVASRNYGSAEAPTYLVLKAPALGSVLQIGIIRPGNVSGPFQINGAITFDGQTTVRANLLEYGLEKPSRRALFVNLPEKEFHPLRVAKTMRIHAGDDGVVTTRSRVPETAPHTDESFELSQMPELLTMMATCVADLRKYWNVSDGPGLGPNLKEGASANLAALFSPDDYPGVAALKRQMGTLQMVMLIDERGQVADCTVVETSRVASLDAQSCVVVRKRAKFWPAIGLDGKPAKSAYRQRIIWRLE